MCAACLDRETDPQFRAEGRNYKALGPGWGGLGEEQRYCWVREAFSWEKRAAVGERGF